MSAKHDFRQAMKQPSARHPEANHGSKEPSAVNTNATVISIDQKVLRSVQHFRQEKSEVLIKYLYQIRHDLEKCLPETLKQIQKNLEAMGNGAEIRRLKHVIRNLILAKLD